MWVSSTSPPWARISSAIQVLMLERLSVYGEVQATLVFSTETGG